MFDRRRDYQAGALQEGDLAADPFSQFTRWLAAAEAAGIVDANAATLATVGADGRPAARVVLIKSVEDGAFLFFTNGVSRKARDLAAHPHAALVCFWRELERQVRIEGGVRRVTDAVADAYFATRPRESQLGAWASPQSDVIPDRAVLEGALREAEARYAGAPVPRPPHWGGFAVTPDQVEFWQGRAGRLHDRLRYRRAGDGWVIERLAP